ncbi:MAG: MFS transporter [Thermomicrobiales bacterium]|nr:MFS transporter [Thermomicrobiales bacterium]
MKTQQNVSAAMIVLVFAAFVSIGLPDALGGTSWPDLRIEFGVPNAYVGILNIPGALAYMLSSALLGTILHRIGTGMLLIYSTILVGTGLTWYALSPNFWFLIPAVALIASGSGAIDAALNLFAAQNLPPRYMSWLHAFYGVGALVGPFLMAIIFGMGQSWRWGYASVAFIIWIMALIFVVTRGHWAADPDAEESHHDEQSTAVSGAQVLRMPRVQLSLLMMMGGAVIECLASLWTASILVNRFDVSTSKAALGVALYWIGLTGGRILIPIIWPNATPIRIQRVSTAVVLAGALAMIPPSLPLSIVGIALIGVGIASIFPIAMTITANRFGPAVSQHAVGYMVSASTIAFSVLPFISGWLADRAGFAIIPVIMVLGVMLLLATQMVLVRGDTPKPADIL